MNIFILANGQQLRFGSVEQPKQLVKLFDKPLLLDTISKLEQKTTAKITILTGNQAIKQVCPLHCNDVGPTVGLQETILKSAPMWDEKTIVLFGDCFFSEEALLTILNCHGDFTFMARPYASTFTLKPYGEAFGFQWTSTSNGIVEQFLAANLDQVSFNLYRNMAGIAHKPNNDYLLERPPCLAIVDDFTDDFDFPDCVATWKKQWTLLKGNPPVCTETF